MLEATEEKHEIKMTEGDFGIDLPIDVLDIPFEAQDELELTIKRHMNGPIMLSKLFRNITNGRVFLSLTAEESASLPVGKYVYLLDWKQNGHLMCNLIKAAPFIVEDKA